MKVLLNCDDVFDMVTGGEGDFGRDDEVVRDHLMTCDECRRLAEVTRPIANVFARAGQAERHHLDAASLSTRVMAQLNGERTVALAAVHRRTFLLLTAQAWSQLGTAAAVLLAVGGLFWAAGPSESAHQARIPAFASSLETAAEPVEHGLLHLASLQLPEKCLKPLSPSPSAAGAFQCCTRCHHAGDMIPAVRLVAFSQQSCTACHRS